jgi:hypothetical protein
MTRLSATIVARLEKLSEVQIALLLSLITFAVYAMTMCRTIYTGDDGDFELAMATGGVCHPTGYPLFMLMGRFFMWALSPILAEPAARINLMTTIFGAASVGMFYRFLRQWIPNKTVPMMASLLLAFSPTLWQQCLSCEVYSLTCLFLCTLLYLASRLYHGEVKVLPLMTFLYGLSLTNHMTMALFFPGFLVFVWCYGRAQLWPLPRFLRLAGLFLLPLLLYAYLPLSAKYSHAPMIWGDPQTPAHFYDHISGKLFRRLMFRHPLQTPMKMGFYALNFLRPELQATLLFLPFGIASLWKKGTRPIFWLSLYVFLANVIYAVNYSIPDIYVYYIPSYIIATFWCAMGVQSVSQYALATLWKKINALDTIRLRHIRLATIVALVLPMAHMSLNYASTDKSSNYLEEDFAGNILASAPQNAVILTSRETLFTLWYRHWVKGERPDVLIVEPYYLCWNYPREDHWYFTHVERQWPSVPQQRSWMTPEERAKVDSGPSKTYVDRLVRTAFAQNRPVIRIGDTRVDPYPPYTDMLDHFTRIPWGVGERLYEKGQEPDAKTLYAANRPIWDRVNLRGLLVKESPRDPFQSQIFDRYASAFNGYGALAETQGDLKTAQTAYELATQILPGKQTKENRDKALRLSQK